MHARSPSLRRPGEHPSSIHDGWRQSASVLCRNRCYRSVTLRLAPAETVYQCPPEPLVQIYQLTRQARSQTEAIEQQPTGDCHIEQVPGNAIEKRGPIGTGEIVDGSRHPAPERHSDDGCGENQAYARTGFACGIVFAHDERVAWHDAALCESEQSRHDIERRQAVEWEIEDECQALQAGAEYQRACTTDSVGNQSRYQAADDTQSEHQ